MLGVQRNYFPKTPFEREHFSKGKMAGKAEAILDFLAARGLAVTEEQRAKLLACTDVAKLNRLIARVVAVASTDELLADL